MKKAVLTLNMILLLALIVMDVCLIVFDGLLLKAITSSIFVIIGVINFVFAFKMKVDIKFPLLLLIGLVFAMSGDIVLEINFICGACLFAIGHIMFFISYCAILRFSAKDLLFGAIIFVPSMLFMILAPIFDYGGVFMEVVCVIYALIISFMVGKSIANFLKDKSVTNIVILLGSILFFLSDLMLLLNVFAGLPVVSVLCLALYYPAEFLLAFSIFIYANKKMTNAS